MATTAEKVASIVDYYCRLIIMQYIKKPKASANVKLLPNTLLADGISFELERAFDIDTAVGPQLTILGKYVGVPRTIYGVQLNRTFFQFTDYPTPLPVDLVGFRDYTDDLEPGSYFNSYIIDENSVYTLTDDDLRFLIKIKIITNNTASTFSGLQEIIFNSFQNELQVFDNKDMSMTVFASIGASQLAFLAIKEDIIPFPACVLVNLFFAVEFPDKLFGFVTYDNQITTNVGFQDYSVSKEGSLLSYSNLIPL